MIKKLLCILLIAILLVGCSKKENQEENKTKNTLAANEIVVHGIKYKFDQDTEEYKLKFKIASNLRKVDTGNAMNYYSEEVDGNKDFVFRIFYYKNSSIDHAIKDTTESYDKKWETKFNDLDYSAVHFVNPVGVDTETNIYYHKNKKDVYAFCFTSNQDISRLENIFLSSIIYPE